MARPRKYKTVEQMQKAIDEYFKQCDLADKPYTVTGLALALDFEDRRSLLDYCEYEDLDNIKFSHTIKRAKSKIESNIEEKMLTGKYNPTSGIFNLKNNFNWKDKQEVEQTGESKMTIVLQGEVAEWAK